jgi:hypothetical protein
MIRQRGAPFAANRKIVGIALLEAERARQDVQHELEEPCSRDRCPRDNGHRQRRSECGFLSASRRGGCRGCVGIHCCGLRLAASFALDHLIFWIHNHERNRFQYILERDAGENRYTLLLIPLKTS